MDDRSRTGVLVGIATAVDYVAWLAWDRERYLGDDGLSHGPYEAWQVVGLVAVLAAVVFAGGRRGHALTTAAVATAVLTACWLANVFVEGVEDGLFLVGAMMVAVATFAGGWLVATLGRASRGARP